VTLDELTARIRSARIIAKALIDMRGSTVKAVFEAAARDQITVTDWRRRDRRYGGEELFVEGVIRATGRSFAIVSAPFYNGLVDDVAAELGRVALSQQIYRGFSMAGIDLKIKGLSDVVKRAREGISSVRAAASGVDQSAMAFVASAASVQQQIDAARSDLEFEATSLGNGGPASLTESDTSVETPKAG
jgi:hypothetical protein